VLLAAVIASAWTGVAYAQGQRDVSRFQRPAEERSIDAPEDGDALPRRGTAAENPENIEDVLYFRERPDTLGQAVRTHQNRQIQRLLQQRERLVTTRRAEAIRLLEQFIREEPEDAPEMPDALMRLAELKWEHARVEYLAAFAAWQRVPERNRGRAPQPEYDEALRLYDRILENHPRFARYDLVLYMKAYALVEKGEDERALELYRRILADFPRSRFRPDAHFALAESKFTGTYDYPAALEEYENVLQYPDSGLADIALFKSAWCLWRMNRTTEAARRFRQVLDLGRNSGAMSADQRRRLQELQDEALDYLIQVFVEDERNTAQDVFAFLEEIGGEQYASRVLTRLSETYFGQARYERGIEAYELLLRMEPGSPDAPKWQHAIAQGYAAVGNEEKTIEALETLAEHARAGTAWARLQGDPESVARGNALAERALRRQALSWHEEGQRESQRPRLERAAQLYGVYLEHFPRSRAAYQIQFYRAEILFHRLERWADAGDSYLAAAQLDRQGEFTRDALYNAIGAFERVRESELENCGTGEGETARCGESENDRKFSTAIELYVELFPNDPDLPEILFRQGRLYYDRRIYDPAVRLFGQLLERFPTSQYAQPAGELILDSFNRAQDYANIETWARRLKSAPSFQTAEHQRRLDGLILQSVFKIGEQLGERGEHAEAANAYFRAAEEFPNDDRARQAYFNAGVERQRAGDPSGAAEAFDRLIERHPGSAEGALGAWTAAQLYESIAQFSDAARYYETYAERFPRGEKVSDALYNAVLLRVTAGDWSAGVANGNRFIQRFPRHDSVAEVYFFIGRAHEGAEDWGDAAELYRRFTRSTRNLDLQVEATTRLAQVLLRANNERGASRALDDAVRLGRRNAARLEQGLYYAAQARYLQGDLVLAQYEAIQIAGDVAGLRRRLQRKSELLQEAALIYADVVEFQVAEWVTAALFQIGRSYELFAEGLRNAPVPEGLNEEEEQSYRDQLAMFIIPMEERALEAFEGGYQKALELRIYNRWTARLREALTRLNDVQYPPFREMGGDIVEGEPLPMPEPLDGLRRGAAGSTGAGGES
jgi:TolA-binding protein